MLKRILTIIIVVLIGGSCKKQLPVIGGTSAQSMANEWWVTLKVGSVDLIGTHVKFATYNTAANDNTMWVDDLKNGYGFKVKATADYTGLTFTAIKASNEYYNAATPASFPLTVNLINGKVLVGQGHSKAGNVVDSIYTQAVFSDDPNTTYIISGHARTRLIEDDY